MIYDADSFHYKYASHNDSHDPKFTEKYIDILYTHTQIHHLF